MKSIKQRIIEGELNFNQVVDLYSEEITAEDIEFISKNPSKAQTHTIYTMRSLKDNKNINEDHILYFMKKYTFEAISNFSDKFTEKHIRWLAENHPDILKRIFSSEKH